VLPALTTTLGGECAALRVHNQAHYAVIYGGLAGCLGLHAYSPHSSGTVGTKCAGLVRTARSLATSRAKTFAWHDARDLGNSELRVIARQFGYTLDELRRLV
jgi:hypothetical protein